MMANEQSAVENVTEKAGEAVSAVGSGAKKVASVVAENPVLAAAGAAAVGAAVGGDRTRQREAAEGCDVGEERRQPAKKTSAKATTRRSPAKKSAAKKATTGKSTAKKSTTRTGSSTSKARKPTAAKSRAKKSTAKSTSSSKSFIAST